MTKIPTRLRRWRWRMKLQAWALRQARRNAEAV